MISHSARSTVIGDDLVDAQLVCHLVGESGAHAGWSHCFSLRNMSNHDNWANGIYVGQSQDNDIIIENSSVTEEWSSNTHFGIIYGSGGVSYSCRCVDFSHFRESMKQEFRGGTPPRWMDVVSLICPRLSSNKYLTSLHTSGRQCPDCHDTSLCHIPAQMLLTSQAMGSRTVGISIRCDRKKILVPGHRLIVGGCPTNPSTYTMCRSGELMPHEDHLKAWIACNHLWPISSIIIGLLATSDIPLAVDEVMYSLERLIRINDIAVQSGFLSLAYLPKMKACLRHEFWINKFHYCLTYMRNFIDRSLYQLRVGSEVVCEFDYTGVSMVGRPFVEGYAEELSSYSSQELTAISFAAYKKARSNLGRLHSDFYNCRSTNPPPAHVGTPGNDIALGSSDSSDRESSDYETVHCDDEFLLEQLGAFINSMKIQIPSSVSSKNRYIPIHFDDHYADINPTDIPPILDCYIYPCTHYGRDNTDTNVAGNQIDIVIPNDEIADLIFRSLTNDIRDTTSVCTNLQGTSEDDYPTEHSHNDFEWKIESSSFTSSSTEVDSYVSISPDPVLRTWIPPPDCNNICSGLQNPFDKPVRSTKLGSVTSSANRAYPQPKSNSNYYINMGMNDKLSHNLISYPSSTSLHKRAQRMQGLSMDDIMGVDYCNPSYMYIRDSINADIDTPRSNRAEIRPAEGSVTHMYNGRGTLGFDCVASITSQRGNPLIPLRPTIFLPDMPPSYTLNIAADSDGLFKVWLGTEHEMYTAPHTTWLVLSNQDVFEDIIDNYFRRYQPIHFGDRILVMNSMIPRERWSMYKFTKYQYAVNTYIGMREQMEDQTHIVDNRYLMPANLTQSAFDIPIHIYGCYDGHGGLDCALKVKEELPMRFLDQLRSPQNIERMFSHMGGVKQALESALQDSFLMTDLYYVYDVYKRGASQKGESAGSTAVLNVVMGSILAVANCGDSRSILSKQGKLTRLSSDDVPSSHRERKRLENIRVADNRLDGRLAVTRAFGDLEYKIPVYKGLVVSPRVTINTLTDDDEFLLSTTDGAIEVTGDSGVLTFFRHYAISHLIRRPNQTHNQWYLMEPTLILGHMWKKFISKACARDNMTVMIVVLNNSMKVK